MKVVLVMFKGDERRTFTLERDQTRLGRRQDCHLRIPTRDVSRQHCELFQRGGKLAVKDLGSSNGTFVNDKRVAETELKAGDRLRVGPVTFFIQIDGKPATFEPPKMTDSAAAVTPVPAAATPPRNDEPTFELSDADIESDEPIETLEEWEDEKDMP